MKVSVHAGHNYHVRGASGYLDEVNENRKVLSFMQELSGNAFIDCTDTAGRSQRQNLSNLCTAMNKSGADLNLSIHLNSGGGHGCECIIYPGSSCAGTAAKISAAIAAALGIRNRGVKTSKTLYVLKHSTKPTIIIECCFVDDAEDAKHWNDRECARAIVYALDMLKVTIKQTGWQHTDSYWYYINPEGNMVTGWQHIGSYWYYFAANGYMQTGWQHIGSYWYYLTKDGNMATGWQHIGSYWYYLTKDGNMATGWQHIGSYWYYFAKEGNMVTGWHTIDGKQYFFYPDGNLATDTTTPDGYQVNESGECIK